MGEILVGTASWTDRSALWPLYEAGKLGALLFQFPPWFTAMTHVVFNNCCGDHAQRNAERMAALLGVEAAVEP
ncbi:hypothetical protein [Actinocorallia aurantiaca]|uniref:hypothetical protein n=1 Tax=Actinocorallia aurantiaca TaxID=46204 RepID=UPI0031CDF435